MFHLTLHLDLLPGQFCRLLERLAGHYIEHWPDPFATRKPLKRRLRRAMRRYALVCESIVRQACVTVVLKPYINYHVCHYGLGI